MQTMSSIAINTIDLEQAAFIQIANHTGVQIKHKTVICMDSHYTDIT